MIMLISALADKSDCTFGLVLSIAGCHGRIVLQPLCSFIHVRSSMAILH
jgi:hypothetical protein